MPDIKTNLRELSVAVIFGLLNRKVSFSPEQLQNPQFFWRNAEQLISNDISSAKNLLKMNLFKDEYSTILNNGYRLANAIVNNKHFKFNQYDKIFWNGCDTQKTIPHDITLGKYKFSLKEESYILENMGFYHLLNCFTNSKHKRGKHIFKDYATDEYNQWFKVTWSEMINYLSHVNSWSLSWANDTKIAKINLSNREVLFQFNSQCTLLPTDCDLKTFEKLTTSTLREHVFSKFINTELKNNQNYLSAKKKCATIATKNVASEIMKNLNYTDGLATFLRIYNEEYYYAKTTTKTIEIYKVPSIKTFGNNIIIESVKSYVPSTQANLLTTIKNVETDKRLIIRNECRFSHGQFNGVPEAKMYYENNGSLLTIYNEI